MVSAHKTLTYGSDSHTKLRDRVLELYKMSLRAQSKLHTQWQQAEDLYLAYQPIKETEKARKDRSEQGDLQYSTVILPVSYAVLLTAHAYWTSVFLSRNPVLQYTGRHGESQQKIQAVEAVMDYQVTIGQMLVPMFQWLLDAGKYGFGVVGAYWSTEYSTVSRIVEEQDTFLGIPVGPKKKRKQTFETLGYSGNRLFNVRPQDFFPDPRVALACFQKGEFCGRYVEVGWNSLKASSENYFNLDQAKDIQRDLGSTRRIRTSSQIDLPSGEDSFMSSPSKGMFDLVEMVCELIPSEWGLGEGSRPEKWLITVALEEVIIGCRPLGYNHNAFPYAIMTYEVDNFANNLRGMMDVIRPLAKVMDWLFNSHFYNVRASLNDQLVLDPSRVELADVVRGGPGRIIRLRPTAYGQRVTDAITQLPVQNITRENLRNVQTMFEMIFRATGVNDNLMGLVNAGGRKTATEVRASSSYGVNRLKLFCEYNSALGMAPLSLQMLCNTQQYMDEAQMYKIAGDLMGDNAQFLRVSPEDIEGSYDFVAVDGTLPIDRFAQANLWKEILMGLGGMPFLAQQYDLGGIFSWMAQMAGLKNITQFKIQVQPDQQLAAQAAAGNVRPIDGRLPQAGGGNPPPVTNPAGLAGPLGV